MSCALASVGESILRLLVLGWGVCDGMVAENDFELWIPCVHWAGGTGECHPILFKSFWGVNQALVRARQASYQDLHPSPSILR